MDIIECIKTRRSVRKFNNTPVPNDIIKNIIECSVYSPSWKNTQIPRYTIINDKDKINKFADECLLGFEFNSNTAKNATTLVVISTVNNRSGYERDGSFTTSKGDRWEMFDAGVATQTFSLVAHHHHIGSVIFGIFDEIKVATFINLPQTEKIATILALGYYDDTPQMPPRKNINDIARFI